MSWKSIRRLLARQSVCRHTSKLCAPCSKHGRRLCMACLYQTPWFLFEHTLWEKIPPFIWITHALGL